MSNKSHHLRPEAGGDPARSVSTDLKNQPKAPQDDNDFPDSPEQPADDAPQDKPDLDAFAKRMGTDTIESGEGLDAVPDQTTVDAADDSTKQRLVIAAGGAFVAALQLLVVKRRRKSNHLVTKAAALAAAAKAVPN
jgi:hypothetical protein